MHMHKNAQLCWTPVTNLVIEEYTIHLPGENYMLLLYVLWVIIIENQMEVAECEQSTALYTSEFILQLQSAATSSNTCDHFSHPLSFPFPWFKFF